MKTLYGDLVDIEDSKLARKLFAPPRTVQDRIEQELYFFRRAELDKGYNGPGRFAHCKQLCNDIWRSIPGEESFRWHPWLSDQLEELCQSDNVVISGPASGGKTMGTAMYALLFWWSALAVTGGLVCSTTRDGLKKRLWGDIRNLYVAATRIMGKRGHLIDSDLCLQSAKGDIKHGLFGIAVALGEESKALGRIIGFHPRRIFVGVDELTDVSWAIIEALTNLFTGKQKSKFVGIGNAASIFDSHGKMAEPKDGWNSVNVDHAKWPTKRGGVCLHFDGFKCENVTKGQRIYDFLLTREDIQATERDYGLNSPQMWRFRRGFWPPEGSVRSVLTESLIQRCRAMEKAQWRGGFQVGAALDPAFEGGDRCVLRQVRWGEGEGGLETMELGVIHIVKIDVSLKEPVHYQIAKQVKQVCESWDVPVSNFAMDSTGEGGGLASIIATEWGPGFLQIEFGGKATELPVSKVNPKKCCDEYKNRVTEIWHGVRTVAANNQLLGLDPETAVEFCNRLFTVETKIVLESKREMKARMNGKSPDLADAAACCYALVAHKGGFGAGQTVIDKSLQREWDALVAEFTVDESDTYTHDAIANL